MVVMYTNFHYGIPLTQDISKVVKKQLSNPNDQYELIDALEDMGFKFKPYEGFAEYYVGDTVGFLGVELEDKSIPCLYPVRIDEFNLPV